MTEFAKGGIITGPAASSDSIPVQLSAGCVLSARAVRELGGAASFELLAKLNAAHPSDGPQE